MEIWYEDEVKNKKGSIEKTNPNKETKTNTKTKRTCKKKLKKSKTL